MKMDNVTAGIIRRLERLERISRRLGARDALQVSVDPVLRLTGLRGCWPMDAFASNGNAQDCSGQGHHLTYNGNPTYSYDGLVPYIAFDGVGDYLSRAHEADFDIRGTETYVAAAAQGLSIGGWFYLTEDATDEGLIGKYGAATGNGYLLQKLAANTVRMIVDNGALVPSGTLDITLDAWNHIAGKFISSNDLYVFVNGVKSTNGAGIPAAIGGNVIAFEISGYNNGATELFTGYASHCWLCAVALSDECIHAIFQQQRSLFGV